MTSIFFEMVCFISFLVNILSKIFIQLVIHRVQKYTFSDSLKSPENIFSISLFIISNKFFILKI